MKPDLLSSWTAITGAGGADAWADLMARWAEPHRRYHGLAHLTAVLSIVDIHAEAADDPDAVRLAAWLHDAVYDPARSDNEEQSAQLAEQLLPALGQAPQRVTEVARLVRLTATHERAGDDRNAVLLCDADLAVLGSPPAAYVAYANAIRAEYAHVPDDTFRAGRAAVLHRLLERTALFGLPALAALEQPARDNLRAELQLLED